MICLYCGEELSKDARRCDACDRSFERRSPLAHINHVSQLLGAIDDAQEGTIEGEELEEALRRFLDMFADFVDKWGLAEASLESQMEPETKEDFGPIMAQMDQTLQLGSHAFELLEAALEGDDTLEAGREALVSFFQNICGQAAAILDQLQKLKQDDSTSPGLYGKLPSV